MTPATLTALAVTAAAAAATGAALLWAGTCWWYARNPRHTPGWTGTPGAAPRQRAARAARTVTAWAIVTAAGLTIAAAVSITQAGVPLTAVAAAVGLTAGAATARRHEPAPVSAAAKAHAGASSETHTAAALTRLLGAHAAIFNGLPAAGLGDIDHVIVTSGGIWTVETKSGRGRIARSGGTVHVGRRALERDGTSQAQAAARWLTARLKLPVGAIVCIPGGDGGIIHNNTPICGQHDLPWALEQTHQRIDETQARHAWQQLTTMADAGEPRPKPQQRPDSR